MRPSLRMALLALSLVLLIGPAHGVEAQGQRVVLAYYYAWWAPDAVGPGKSPDWPVTPYHSWDPAVIQQHVAQAASANIDGLVVAWYGPQETNNQTETNFRLILDQAAANGIYALLSVDLGSAAWFTDVQQVIDGLNYALTVHANHPAYFRYNGRPVVFVWYQGRYSLDEWAAIRQQVDPDHNSIWIAEGAMPDAIPTFDGLHLYNIAWADDVYATLAQWANTTRNRGGLWVATAMPGWDNTLTQQPDRYVRDRQEGAFYRDTFAAAAASNPDMVIITSWNEWWEGSAIEPSHNYGDFYLNLTRELAGAYKTSGAVSGGGGSAPPATPTPAPPTAPGSASPVAGPTVTPGATPTATVAAATSTLPPTITPTSPATPTATASPGPITLPTAAPVAEAAEAGNPGDTTLPGGALAWLDRAAANPGERRLILAGLIAGGIGLALLGSVGLVQWRKRRREG